MVTHDLGMVAEICDDVLVMYGGMVAEYASSDVIFNSPQHPYTQRLMEAFPDVEEPGSTLASIPGNPPRLDDLPPGCRFEPRCECQWREAICAQTHTAAGGGEPGALRRLPLCRGSRPAEVDSGVDHCRIPLRRALP